VISNDGTRTVRRVGPLGAETAGRAAPRQPARIEDDFDHGRTVHAIYRLDMVVRLPRGARV
jgi:hypothetical protein